MIKKRISEPKREIRNGLRHQSEAPDNPYGGNGEGGIRTRERACAPYSLSRRVPSATRPPLRETSGLYAPKRSPPDRHRRGFSGARAAREPARAAVSRVAPDRASADARRGQCARVTS